MIRGHPDRSVSMLLKRLINNIYVGNGRCVLHNSNSSTFSMSLDHAILFLVNHACMSAFLGTGRAFVVLYTVI